MKSKSNIEWSELDFSYRPIAYNIRCSYENGEWGDLTISDSEELNISIAATCLHYGQEAFEGIKAFRGFDNLIRVFRLEDHIKRFQDSARGICMPPFPKDKFIEAIDKLISLNETFIPPYKSGATLYIRPLMIGLTSSVLVRPATEFMFVLFACPVGSYFTTKSKPCKMAILRSFDRAAPCGTGAYKVGGNYAASFLSTQLAKEQGYASVIYLDAKEKEYIDECGAANFFGIRENTYITPLSSTILPSITNKSLMKISKDLGLNLEHRPVHVSELSSFEEVGACGTGAVITPIGLIHDMDTNETFEYCPDNKMGKVSQALFERLQAIQYGEYEDIHQWNHICRL